MSVETPQIEIVPLAVEETRRMLRKGSGLPRDGDLGIIRIYIVGPWGKLYTRCCTSGCNTFKTQKVKANDYDF